MSVFMQIMFYLYVLLINTLYGLAYIYPLILIGLFLWILFLLLKNKDYGRLASWGFFNAGVFVIYWFFYNLPMVFDFLSIPYNKGIFEPIVIAYIVLLQFLVLFYYGRVKKISSLVKKTIE